MPKFIQPVSMIFDHTNFYKDNLEQKLTDLGYVFKDFSEKYRFDTLITNYGGKDGDDNIITNLDGSCKDDYNRYYIDNYNPDLFLAIAAMTNDKTGIVGEWINIHNFGSQYPSHPAVMEYLNKEEYNESYIGLAKIIENELDSKDFGEEIIVVLGIDNNIYVLNESNINNKYYKKATLNELVQHFTMKKEDREISTLPEYFAIFNDITNPLWSKYIVWLNDKYNKDYKGSTITCYYGYDGQVKRDSNISNFKNNPTILTLEQWNNIINKDEEILGYKLIKPEYEKSAADLGQGNLKLGLVRFDYKESNYYKLGYLSVKGWSETIENLNKAGVLAIWFEPVYKNKFEIDSYFKCFGNVYKVVKIINDKLFYRDSEHAWIPVDNAVVPTDEEINTLLVTYFNINETNYVRYEKGDIYHDDEVITNFVLKLGKCYNDIPAKSGEYDARLDINSIMFEKTGCVYNTKLSVWLEIYDFLVENKKYI